MVISADGKGIVMRPDALRPATAKAAAAATNKLACRLSKGEKRNRKRLAEVGAVYDLTPLARAPADVLATKAAATPTPAPKPRNKWVTASVVEDAATVIAKVSTRHNGATRTTRVHGWPSSMATTTRSTASKPRRTPEESRSPSSWT